MSYIRPPHVTGHIYHVYNRGVEKRQLFDVDRDYYHFLDTLSFFRNANPPDKLSRLSREALSRELATEPKQPLVRIHAFSLMSNHFHLTIEQLVDGGISTYMRRVLNSYTRYYNTKHNRVGTMFQGRFRSVLVKTDEQFLHLTRYQHLNRYVARLVDDPMNDRWSSLSFYRERRVSRLCDPTRVLALAGSIDNYLRFIQDYADYARNMADIKDLLIDGE